ncbi:MAG: gliding motility-associated C-terminal domain-containing protein [Bacteroidales bacterium]|nr:gliding motility-associated C-terminal domain-containing protein [Bacteroidales bacterium]
MKNLKSSLFKIIITGLFFAFIINGTYSQTCTLCSSCDSVISGNISTDILVPNNQTYCIDSTAIITGNITLNPSAKLCNSGTILGTLTLSSFAKVCNEGFVTTSQLNMGSTTKFYNYGKLIINDTCVIESFASVHNFCEWDVFGNLIFRSSVTDTITGLVSVHGNLIVSNSATLYVDGVCLVDGTDSIFSGSEVTLMNGAYMSCFDFIVNNNSHFTSIGGVFSQLKINGTAYADPSSGYDGNNLDVCWNSGQTPPGTQNGTITYCVNNITPIPPGGFCSHFVCPPIIVPVGITICSGSAATITVTGSTAYSYSWNTGQTGSSITVSPTATTTYTVTTTDICAKTSMTVVTVNPKPNVTATGSTICIGASTTITASGATTYTWNFGLGTGNSKTVNPTTTTTYLVTGTDGNGCTNAAQAVVIVNPLPIVTATGDIICIWDTATISAAGAVTYTWNNSAIGNPITVNPTETTTYTVTGTDANTCTNTANTTVIVNPLPIVTSIGDTICTGSAAHISAAGAITYTWSDTQTGNAILVYPTLNTTYTVTGTDINTCTNTSELMVKIKNSSLWMPNAFTPDGNGHNDVFIIRGVDIIYVDNFELHIFNSSGKSIYVSKSIYEGWNGTNQNTGDKLPEGAYVYYIKGLNCLGEPLILKGMINLIR